jgi:hypothetical protein
MQWHSLPAAWWGVPCCRQHAGVGAAYGTRTMLYLWGGDFKYNVAEILQNLRRVMPYFQKHLAKREKMG